MATLTTTTSPEECCFSTGRPSTSACNPVGPQICIDQKANTYVVHPPSHHNSETKLIHPRNTEWTSVMDI